MLDMSKGDKRDLGELLIGVEGPEARTPAAVAFWVIDPLTEWFRGCPNPTPEVVAWMQVIKVLAEHHGRSVMDSAHGTLSDTPRSDASGSRWIDTNTAAREIGCTQRNVVALLQRGTLRGNRRGRDWQIDPKSVREYMAR